MAWTVKPDAQEPYLYFYEKIPFSDDKFATGVEIRPSNFSVVHHSGVYIVDIPDGYTVKDGYLYDADGKQVPPSVPMGKKATSGDVTPLAGADKIISYVPGRGYERYPDGYASATPPAIAGRAIGSDSRKKARKGDKPRDRPTSIMPPARSMKAVRASM